MTTEFERWMELFLVDVGANLGLSKEQIFCEFVNYGSISSKTGRNRLFKSKLEYLNPLKE